MNGRNVVIASWVGNVVFLITAVPDVLGVDAFDTPSVIVTLVLFASGTVLFLVGFGIGIVRSGRGEEVAVANLFFLQGSAPRDVQRHLLGSLAVSILIAAATAVGNPFGVLVPMYPLALCGLWAARHGTFPPRRVRPGGAPRR